MSDVTVKAATILGLTSMLAEPTVSFTPRKKAEPPRKEVAHRRKRRRKNRAARKARRRNRSK